MRFFSGRGCKFTISRVLRNSPHLFMLPFLQDLAGYAASGDVASYPMGIDSGSKFPRSNKEGLDLADVLVYT